MAPVPLGDGLRTFYDRTLAFQADRGSPFSIWGLYGLPGPRRRRSRAALILAVVVAFVPRRRDPVTVAALGAATLIALQLALEHWFYLYLVWFLPLAVRGAVRRPQDRLDRVGARRPGAVRGADDAPPSATGPRRRSRSASGICVRKTAIDCSRLTPITPPRAPVIPTSVT